MTGKIQYFDNKRFIRDEKTGYYLCSSSDKTGVRKRMHVYVWEFYNGSVPSKYHVHHKDGDKSNNCIENLELLSEYEHLSFHGKKRGKEHHQEIIQILDEHARPKANEWHGSESGREWHRKHYEKMKDKLHISRDFICEFCGKTFKSTQIKSRFCSNKCKSAWRRKAGLDNVTKICQDCGKEYVANKYSQTKYCPLCKNKKHTRNRKSRCL